MTFSTAALSGGGSRSVHWAQMFADGLGVPVTVAEARETGALGAAMAAAIGVGLYPAEAEAVAAMARPARAYNSDPAMRAHYDRRYAIWRRLTEAVDPLWRELASPAPVAS